jgi:hypothetical protein
MDPVALQQFMKLRESAQARMQTPAAAAPAKSTQVSDWQALLESKRREMGIAPQQQTAPAKAVASQTMAPKFAQGDYQSRAESLRAQAATGMPIRKIGNLIDMRA